MNAASSTSRGRDTSSQCVGVSTAASRRQPMDSNHKLARAHHAGARVLL
ncbi:hypothetical protein [Flexivirga alba]|uniref:Uncharacterized protein n=1 Tax=Flexivirga alba TaxID=702742 RepID=A0ABW2AGL2_9MICO